ncbi:hypothetical protein BDZ91DRAFT_721548 [Kalaharituber pfeilii]|nr:hypothetical protein BDZ91DRAFT_721548 [Kalaharituber pfeilii]
MVHQISPVSIFASEQVYKSILLMDFNIDQLVGMPDTIRPARSVTAVTPSSIPNPVPEGQQVLQLPKTGDCIEVCGANDCDYLVAMPGLGDHGLSLSEKVAKDILSDTDDFSTQRASWEPVAQSKCEEKKTLHKRQWYPSYGPQEYGPYSGPQESQCTYEDGFLPPPYPAQHQYTQAPLEYPSSPNGPQTERSNKNIKISNENSGNLNEKESEKPVGHNFSTLTDRPRGTVCPSSPANKKSPSTKQNVNKGATRRFPIESGAKNGPTQTSRTESYSLDPAISFTTAKQPQGRPQEVIAPHRVPDDNYERGYIQQPAAAAAAAPNQPQVAVEDPSAPRITKIENPDGSIEYSFGVTSGEFKVYNEGDPVKRPGQKEKSAISDLKASLGIDDDISQSGWTRKVKRALAPDNKPTARKISEATVEGDLLPSGSPGSRRDPAQKADFMNGGGVPIRKQAPKHAPKSAPKPHQPPQSQKPEPEQGSEEADEQAILDQKKVEADRLRRLSLKQFYKQMASQGDEIEVSRDKWAEEKITEESERIAAENAQKKREERARQMAGKDLKAPKEPKNWA